MWNPDHSWEPEEYLREYDVEFYMDPESDDDVLLEDHPQMITHALTKAFKPFVDAINSRVYTAYIIPDWYPLRLRREKWDGESGHLGKIYVVGSGWNRNLFTIWLDKDGYFQLRCSPPKGGGMPFSQSLSAQFFAADPKSIQKLREEIINYYKGKITEINLDDLPLG